jgi:hypothetical protein
MVLDYGVLRCSRRDRQVQVATCISGQRSPTHASVRLRAAGNASIFPSRIPQANLKEDKRKAGSWSSGVNRDIAMMKTPDGISMAVKHSEILRKLYLFL